MLLIIQFIICSLIIIYSGQRVAKYGDVIAEKTGLGSVWVGIILLAVATGLPELFTGISSIVFLNAPNLSMGNLFGANIYNLTSIALMEKFYKKGALFAAISPGQLLAAVFSALLILIAAIGIILGNFSLSLDIWGVSFISLLIMFTYVIFTKIIFNYEQKQKMLLKEILKEERIISKYAHITLKKAALLFGINALLILLGGIWLAYIGDEVSRLFGLSHSFTGSLLLSLSTTLPEFTVTVSAVALGAEELALANIFGSIMVNTAIIFINDLLYHRSPIFLVLAAENIFIALTIALMTLIVCVGIILKPQKQYFGLSAPSLLLIAIFLGYAVIQYMIRSL